ncbi:MAG: hypothetical protein AB8E15_05415 [Bdellovibrionales bacterium]
MSDIFNANNKYDEKSVDPAFVSISENYEDTRELVEKLWIDFKGICESKKEFLAQIKIDFFARCWELYLGYNFIQNSEAEVIPKNKTDGPDFNIKVNDQLIYVEAICPKNSIEVKAAYDNQRKVGRAMSPPDEEKRLIITGALSTKIQQYHERIEKELVNPDTPYIIAINAGNITFADYELLISILFEVGDQYIEIARGTTEVVGQGFKVKEPITGFKDKNLKEEIPANLFFSEYGQCISGIIFSSKNILNAPPDIGSDLLFVPNPFAANKVEGSLFEVGAEYVIRDDNLLRRTLFTGRENAIYQIANKIYFHNRGQIVKVAIDGVDGAGKTFFAKELKESLNEVANNVEKLGIKDSPPRREIIHSSVDGFHNPRDVRYKKGKGSPEGFFEDSYNYPKFKELLLEPLNNGGNRLYADKYFDHKIDEVVSTEKREASENSILLVDGIFLHRAELKDYWDYSIFLDVEFENSVARCASRDNSCPDPDDDSNRRYVEGQKLYFNLDSPKERATLIFDNNNLQKPKVYGL